MEKRLAASPVSRVLVYVRLAFVVPLVAACLTGAPANQPASLEVPSPTTALTPTATQAPEATAQPAPPATAQPTAAPTALPPARPTPPPPSAQPTPVPTPIDLVPKPAAGKFAMDVGKPKSFVRQATSAMCVPASMQIMINLMSATAPDRSRETQQSLYTLARGYSPWITSDRDGAAANGWAAGLNQLGYGQFEPKSIETMDAALEMAARQMRFTGKPVGLIVWAGDHAWVMSGFKATADPAWTDDFDVTAVWVEDPWFGRTDRTWGSGLAPHTLVSTADLATDFVGWPSRYFASVYGMANRYVIVVPLS